MAKITVDVVLLPSPQMMDRVIEANRALSGRWTDKITLNRSDCLPHISLAMGCIEEKDISSIENALRTLALSQPPGPLSVVGIHVGTDAAGREVSVFEVGKTERLETLHTAVMRELASYFSYHVTANMVLCDPPADESTLQWIRDYPEKSSFENFVPHITIGFGRIGKELACPIRFQAIRLALCRLGNHCTCREVLASAEFVRQPRISGKSG